MTTPIDLVRVYEELLRASGDAPAVDQRTAADLDLDDVFRGIDRTAGAPGRQRLYARLRRPTTSAAAGAFDELVSGIGPDAPPARRAFEHLGGASSHELPHLFLGHEPERPAAFVFAPVLTVAAAVLALASPLSAKAFLALVGLCVMNIVVRLAYRSRVATHLRALPPLRALIRAGIALSRPESGIPAMHRERVAAAVAPLRVFLAPTTWVAAEAEMRLDTARLAYEYANLLFLLDVDAYLFSFALLRGRREAIRELWETVGDLDAAFAVSEWRRSLRSWCRPRFVAAGAPLRIGGAFHPLLLEPVANDVTVSGRGLLLTGSNMSGKTTLLKTLGLETLLGGTVATCPATSYEGPFLVPSSAIGRRGCLREGISDYLAEVRRVLELVRQVEGAARLFLLDELFRGTNALERIAAGKAVLAYLSRGAHVTAVSTHDVELLLLLAERYEPWHFREAVAGGDLTFDYVLRPGLSSSRNAIALLAGAGFPESLVDDARETVEALKDDSPGRPRRAG